MEVSNNFLTEHEDYDEEDERIWTDCDIDGYENFSKKNEESKVWWTKKIDEIGELNISFDKKKIYNLYRDYPYNMSKEEVETFDKEESYWAEFFAWRKH